MNILSFDTCLDKMYVAIGDASGFLDSKIVGTTETAYHSAFIISTITTLLKENGFKPADIGAIATNIGPGSFTGIRACTTVARVMAQGLNLKTTGVSSLEILAKINQTAQEKKTLVALDARKDMAYVAIFDGAEQIMVPQSILLEDLKEMIQKEDYFIVTDDKLEPIIGGTSYQKGDSDLGKYLIEIALEKLNSDCDTDWKKLLPLYIQPPALNVKKQA